MTNGELAALLAARPENEPVALFNVTMMQNTGNVEGYYDPATVEEDNSDPENPKTLIKFNPLPTE